MRASGSLQVMSSMSSMSSDGNLVVPTTLGAGKKKNQLKRSCNARSTTIVESARLDQQTVVSADDDDCSDFQ